MRAAVLDAPGQISVVTFADPVVVKPTDAVVQVVAACVCGSDLWPYRGVSAGRGRMGHEFLGVVVDVGAEVTAVRTGQLVIAPFLWSCGHCVQCRAGWPTSCLVGGGYGGEDRDGIMVDGGQGEYVRVPQADGTLVAADVPPDDDRIPALLSLSDVMGTGYHAARGAGAGPGTTIAVVGDGAVGLCAVLGARHLGAERIVILSTHPDRAELAVRFGATDVVAARGDEASDAVRELTDGVGADGVCECVGTQGSWATAVAACRPRRHDRLGRRAPRGHRGAPAVPDVPAQHRDPRRHRAGPPLPARTAALRARRLARSGAGIRPDRVLGGHCAPGTRRWTDVRRSRCSSCRAGS